MFDLNAPPEKSRLHADIPKDLLAEVKELVEFVQVAEDNQNVKLSHVVEHILREYLDSRKKEVQAFREWKEKGQEHSEEGTVREDVGTTEAEARKEREVEPETGEIEVPEEREEAANLSK